MRNEVKRVALTWGIEGSSFQLSFGKPFLKFFSYNRLLPHWVSEELGNNLVLLLGRQGERNLVVVQTGPRKSGFAMETMEKRFLLCSVVPFHQKLD